MKILGLDPGIARTGFGLIDTAQERLYVTCGCLTTASMESAADRLVTLGTDLTTLVDRYRPDMAVVETVFFGSNSKTAMLTAETRGVLLYVLRKKRIVVQSLTPLQIKSRLTGYGSADKHQVQTVVMARLKLTGLPRPDDAADALAAALSLGEDAALFAQPVIT
jgi:crossover junction endodeoxyribonuclease RuvC